MTHYEGPPSSNLEDKTEFLSRLERLPNKIEMYKNMFYQKEPRKFIKYKKPVINSEDNQDTKPS